MYRLLIVDDERHIVNWLSGLFSSLDGAEFDIYRAYSGTDAIAVLADTNIDIVLTDYRMPGMNGLELLDRVKANWADRRVIILSGYDEFEYIYKAASHGAVRYILKTEDDDVIVGAVLDAVKSIEKGRSEAATVDKSRFAEGLLDYMDRCERIGRYVEDRSGTPLPYLDPTLQVLPVMGALLQGSPVRNRSELLKLRYSLELLSGNCLSGYVRFTVLETEGAGAFWLLQELPVSGVSSVPFPPLPFLCQLFEELQSTAVRSLGISMCFLIQDSSVEWTEVKKAKGMLSSRIIRSVPDSAEATPPIIFAPAGMLKDGSGDHALAARIRRFVDGNLGGDLTLTNISRHVYYNPSYISRIFKRESGLNLSEYITEKRLAKAGTLLEEGNSTISHIAQECGFDSSQYFATVFKKFRNRTPQEFRDDYRERRQDI